MAAVGPEWGLPGIDGTTAEGELSGGVEGAEASGSGGFGAMLAEQLQSLSSLQAEASEASTALATGRAADPTSVVMAIERAQLSMQLAAQVRTKATDAINDIFHTTV
jgi:flagellar hook-basal body complex protein FliE